MDGVTEQGWKARVYRAEHVVAECRGLLADLGTPGLSYGAARRLRAILDDYDLSE